MLDLTCFEHLIQKNFRTISCNIFIAYLFLNRVSDIRSIFNTKSLFVLTLSWKWDKNKNFRHSHLLQGHFLPVR